MTHYPNLKESLAIDLVFDLLNAVFQERGARDSYIVAQNIVDSMSIDHIYKFLSNAGYFWSKKSSKWIYEDKSSWLRQELKPSLFPLPLSIALSKRLYSLRRWIQQIGTIIFQSMLSVWK